jgi:proline racemase
MLEPRGHNDMYGCVLTPPVSPGSDMGVLFMHNEGYSTMCGHGIIALVTYAVENDLVTNAGNVRIDTPAGTVKARAAVDGTRVTGVSFENVPAFVYRKDVEVDGTTLDIVFGGAFYALLESPLPIDAAHLDDLRELGMNLKRAIERDQDVIHPGEPGLFGIYGTIFTGKPENSESTIRNVTIFADAEVDRSPCGTGTCGILASRFTRGLIREGEWLINEGIIGTTFSGRVLSRTRAGSHDAIIPEIAGAAYITGYHTFVADPADPVAAGFRIH